MAFRRAGPRRGHERRSSVLASPGSLSRIGEVGVGARSSRQFGQGRSTLNIPAGLVLGSPPRLFGRSRTQPSHFTPEVSSQHPAPFRPPLAQRHRNPFRVRD